MDGNRTKENCRYRLVCMPVGRSLGFDAKRRERNVVLEMGDEGREGAVEIEMKNWEILQAHDHISDAFHAIDARNPTSRLELESKCAERQHRSWYTYHHCLVLTFELFRNFVTVKSTVSLLHTTCQKFGIETPSGNISLVSWDDSLLHIAIRETCWERGSTWQGNIVSFSVLAWGEWQLRGIGVEILEFWKKNVCDGW